MAVIWILIVAIVFQVVVAVLALRLIKATMNSRAWWLIAAASTVMVFASIHLYREILLMGNVEIHIYSALLILLESILMLIGVAYIRPAFMTYKEYSKQLAESEMHFSDLFENFPVGVYQVTPRGKQLRVNQTLVDIFGYPSRAEFQKIRTKDMYLYPKQRKIFTAALKKDGLVNGFEAQYKRYDGTIIWIEENVREVRDQKGKLLCYEGSMVDITEQKRAEEALNKSEENLAKAQEIAHHGSWEWDIVNNKIFWSKEMYRIYELDPDIGRLNDLVYEMVHPEDKQIYSDGIKAVFEGSHSEFLQYRIITSSGEQKYLQVGVEPLNDPSGKLVRLNGYVQDVTERKRAEKALIESQAMYQNLVETSQDLIWRVDEQGRFTYLNLAWEDTTGYKVEEMLGKTFTDFKPPEIVERDMQEFERHLAGGSVRGFETINIAKSGEEIHLVVNAIPLFDNEGNIIGTQGTSFDITERKRAELALKESENLHRAMIEGIPDLIFHIDKHGNYLNVFCDPDSPTLVFRGDHIGKNIRDILSEEIASQIIKYLDIVISTGVAQTLTYALEVRGKKRFVEDRIVQLNENEAIRISRDVTGRTKAEKELVSHQKRLETLTEATFEGIVFAEKGKIIDVNKQFSSMMGYEREELIGIDIVEFVYPDDREFITKNIRGEFEDSFEVRNLHKDGSIIYVEVHSQMMEIDQKTIRVTAVRDVTERKRTEDALLKRNEDLALLSTLAFAVNSISELNEILNFFLVEIEALFDLKASEIWLYDISEGILEPGTYHGLSEEFALEIPNMKLGIGLPGIVAQMDQTLVIEDLKNDDRFLRQTKVKYGFNSSLGIPIISQKGLVGAVNFFEENTDKFTPELIRILTTVGQIAGIAIERSRTQEKLFAAENIQESILELAPAGIITIDDQQDIIYINNAGLEIFGYREEEILGRHLKVLIPDGFHLDHIGYVEDFKVGSEEFRGMHGLRKVSAKRKNGEIFPAEISLSKTEKDGEVLFTAVARDISQREWMENTLQQQAEDLNALYGASRALLGPVSLDEMLDTICKSIIDHFGLKMTWVGGIEEGSYVIKPLASFGFEEGYLDSIKVTYDESTTGQGPTGKAVRERKAVVINQAQTDPTYEPWREAALSQGYGSSGAFPLIAGDELVGVLNICHEDADYFSEEKIYILQSFANQAAVAMRNAILFEQVVGSRKQLQILSQQLVQVQEKERRFLARELHDEIGQLLTGLKLSLESIPDMAIDQRESKIYEAAGQVNTLISEVRELSLNLRPAMLDSFGLLHAFLWHFERYTEQTGIQVDFSQIDLERRFSEEIEITVYRIVQEALTNVARHANSGSVMVEIIFQDNALSVVVQDQGKGFDFNSIESEKSGGLRGMHERANLIGGKVTIIADEGKGTSIIAEIPIEKKIDKRKTPR